MNRVINEEEFSILDFLFQNKNKSYGAYELRKKYPIRMYYAVIVTIVVSILIFLISVFPKKASASEFININIDKTVLTEIHVPKDEPPIPPQPTKPPPSVENIKAVQFTTLIVTKEVEQSEMPPMDKIEIAAIATFNQEGDSTDIPAIAKEAIDNGVVAAPPAPNVDEYFRSVEIQSEYISGREGWIRFLKRTMRYPAEALDNEIEGVVIVEFKVDESGNVHDVKAISGPTELHAEAVRVIQRSGKWTPAIQNGRNVKSYKKQPISFKIGVS